MSRLIDADALESVDFSECTDSMEIMAVIDAQPTAYDPDKVVEQSEDALKNEKICYIRAERKCREFESCEECGFARAIEIVKGGGVDA